MKIKLFIITDTLAAHGAQRQILEYLKLADRSYFNIKIVNLDRNYNALESEIRKLDYQVITIDQKGFFSFKTLFGLVGLFLREKPQIVLTYLFTADCYGRLAAFITKVPIIISSARNLDVWKSQHHIIASRILAGVTDKFIINSESIRTFLVAKEKIRPDRIQRIYNGIDLNRFTNLSSPDEICNEFNIPKDSHIVGMVARFNEQKDYKTYLEAAKLITEKMDNVYFFAVGDGPTMPGLKDYAKQIGLFHNIIFTGARMDALNLINCFDIGILSSHYESLPNAVMEYMACGKAVIASAVGGNSELINDGETGFIIEPKNPKALAEKITFLLENSNIRKKMGKDGRAKIEKQFTVGRMVKDTECLFKELLLRKIPEKNKQSDLFCKIAYIVSLFPCWSETFIVNEMRALEQKGAEITIFSIRSDLEKFIQEDARLFIKKTRYPNFILILVTAFLWLIKRPIVVMKLFGLTIFKKHNGLKGLLKSLWCLMVGFQFASAAQKEEICHIHAHFATYPALTALIISRLTRIPFTFTAHAHDIFLDKTFLKEISKESKAIITISNYNKQYILDYCGNGITSKVKVIHCGIDTSEYFAQLKGDDEKENVIISIGRLTEIKGFEYLIRACKIVSQRADFKCHIIGDGPLLPKLNSLIKELNLGDQVFLEGVQDSSRVKEFLEKATLFVMPSVWSKNDSQDGIPIVLMEAMAAGVPVIASRISGIPELVINEETGISFEPGDEMQLAQKIEEVIGNKGLQQKLSLNGRLKVESDFNITKSAGQLFEIFYD